MAKQTLFVIFASPQTHVAQGTCYLAPDASTTMLSSKAAKFYSLADAIAFAEANHIALTAHTYIGVEDFVSYTPNSVGPLGLLRPHRLPPTIRLPGGRTVKWNQRIRQKIHIIGHYARLANNLWYQEATERLVMTL